MAIPMLKIRRPLGRLIFNMGIATPGKTVFLIETAPRTSLTMALFRHQPQKLNSEPYRFHGADVAWWRHQMSFSALLAHCEGNPPFTGRLPFQRRWALVFSLICVWTNGWANNRDAGDMRRHRAHSDVTVIERGPSLERMICFTSFIAEGV